MLNMNRRLSILIISYNRPDDLLDLLQSISEQDAKETILEILILNNASTVPYSTIETFITNNPALRINYTISTENLGVSRGRNRLMSEAKGDLLLVLDDYVLFCEAGALERIEQVFNDKLFLDSNTAVITFKVIYYQTKLQQVTAFPHKQYDELRDSSQFLTYYFAGCAHLMKKGILAQTGLYPEDFFYGMEEYDLSYRIIGAGYTLGYDNSVTFEHKESPLGRQPNHEKLASQWVNKTKVAWRYLPRIYFLTTMFAWSLEYIRKVHSHWGTFLKSWGKMSRIGFSEKRHPLQKSQLAYLKKVKARLWY